MSGRLLVVGDVVTDVVAAPEGPLNPGTDVSARIRMRPGGSGANTAAWAARRGAETSLLARVGADGVEWHSSSLSRAGVRPRLRVADDHATAVLVALLDSHGERTMITDRGAGATLCLDDWDEELLDSADLVHLSGYIWFAPPGRLLAATILDAAARRGVPASVDPASTGFLTEYGPDQFSRDARSAALLLPNLDEARLLSGAEDPKSAARALSLRHGAAAVTLGDGGAIAARLGEIVAEVPAVDVEVVDTVGAGDAFAGGFLAARLAGADLAEAAA
ncbi:MAG: carbohydrate kinase family protein, partial [Stackebrandtia sp.]